MHTIRFLLMTTKEDDRIPEKRFRMLWHIHNQTVKYAQKQLHKLMRDRAYIDAKKEYGVLKPEAEKLQKRLDEAEAQKNPTKPEERSRMEVMNKRLGELADIMNERIVFFCLTKTGLESYVKVMQRRFKKHISSQQAQKEADRVYTGVQKVLYENGKFIHLKKLDDQRSISQKGSANGIKVDLDANTINWIGLTIPFRMNKKDPYAVESVGHQLKYGEIVRLPFRGGWRYYINLYLDGDAPKKLRVSSGLTGIDPGVSTMASVSEKAVSMKELSPLSDRYNKEIARMQRLVDQEKRALNPDNYDADGRIKKGKHNWIISNNCRRHQRRIRELYRKKSASTECSHNHQINELLVNNGNRFLIEDMTYAALQKRSQKPTERQEKATVVKDKNGKEKTVRKCKKKKRFGKSLNDRSPALFVTILTRKAEQYGGKVVKIDTRSFRASQYHHDTGEYIKAALSDRWKTIDGHEIQRDLYSAFLILCSNPSGTAPDRDLCNLMFEHFVTMHDAFIKTTAKENHPACFGY